MTQQEKIISLMIRRHGSQEWFYPPDFMPPRLPAEDPHFIGYEASARLSEIASQYPDLIESRRRGKYTERRIRFERIHEQANKIGGDLGRLLRTQLSIHGIRKPEPPKPVAPQASLFINA